MNFIKEFSEVDSDLQEKIISYVKSDKREFEDSLIYSSAIEEKLLSKEKRTSQFKLFKEKELFDLCKQLVNKISDSNPNYDFKLFENDISYIKYQEGGFFKQHQDYLSLVSNTITEYTLIMSINSKDDICIGGQTRLMPNENYRYSSKATITPKNILIFRKDIDHEGELISKGEKHILTMNLWKFNNSKQVVIIQFPNSNEYYVLSVSNILSRTSNKLSKFIGETIDQVITFVEEEFTFKEFKVIAEIYMNCILNIEDVVEKDTNRLNKIIQAYGFGWKDLLINRTPTREDQTNPNIKKIEESNEIKDEDFEDESSDSSESSEEEDIDPEDESEEDNINPDEIKMKNYAPKIQQVKFRTHNEKKLKIEKQLVMTPIGNKKVHIFPTDAHYIRTLDVIKKNQLPYMPFKIIFCEGSVNYDGDHAYWRDGENPTRSYNVPMTPVWSTFSERENIYFGHNVVSLCIDDEATEGLQVKTNKIITSGVEEPYLTERFKKMKNGKSCKICTFGGNAGYRELFVGASNTNYENLIGLCTEKEAKEKNISYEDSIYTRYLDCIGPNLNCTHSYPSLREKFDVIFDNDNASLPSVEKSGFYRNNQLKCRNKYYSVTRENKLVIEPIHFDLIRKKIVETKLFDLAKERINQTKLTFPQIPAHLDRSFCNESVYGTLNIIEICGIMRLD